MNNGQGMLGGLELLLNGLNLKIAVRRDNLLEDALNQLISHSKHLKKPLKVVFVGEEGED